MIHRNAISPGTNFNSTNIPFELMFIQQIMMLIQRIMCGSIVEHGVICNEERGHICNMIEVGVCCKNFVV